MTIAEALAERIAGVRYDDLPAPALHWAKVAILDTVGCTLAGSAEPCARIADRVVTGGASSGPSLIFGTDRRAAPLDAALINGTAAHALDYDDVSNSMGGHPSAPLLPALFALAETRNTDGRAFLAAFVTGFETETRIGRGVNFHHYEKGWHPTATLGVFGATAACCHLLGLPQEQTAVALGLAASFASGVKANFGTMTKPLHVGHCSRNGLLAALLAADGFTANPGAFEHKQGFLAVFNGAGNFNADAILRDWGAPWDIVEPSVGIKQYPCCGSTHSAVDAMLMLVREHDLTPAMVARVEFVDASAPVDAHQSAGAEQRSRCQVQRAVLPGAGADGSPCVAGTFRGRGLSRAGGRCVAAAYPRRAASGDGDGFLRAFRR